MAAGFFAWYPGPSLRISRLSERREICWDNAVVESFFSSLNKERIKKRMCKTRELARADVFDYIEVFYNRQRRRSYLGGVIPEVFEQASF
jgi:putative transposase